MKRKKSVKRLKYLIAFIILAGVEVLIALFVHDAFIRPYFGDVLVIGVIYCFVRIFFPNGLELLALYVFLFAVAVEIGQYFDYVTLLGLSEIRFFRILLGTSFSWYDVLCYAVGSALCFVIEFIIYRIEMITKETNKISEDMMYTSLKALISENETLLCAFYGLLLPRSFLSSYADVHCAYIGLTNKNLLVALTTGIIDQGVVPLTTEKVKIHRSILTKQYVVFLRFKDGKSCKIRMSKKIAGDGFEKTGRLGRYFPELYEKAFR